MDWLGYLSGHVGIGFENLESRRGRRRRYNDHLQRGISEDGLALAPSRLSRRPEWWSEMRPPRGYPVIKWSRTSRDDRSVHANGQWTSRTMTATATATTDRLPSTRHSAQTPTPVPTSPTRPFTLPNITFISTLALAVSVLSQKLTHSNCTGGELLHA